jgi:hypothetical protein
MDRLSVRALLGKLPLTARVHQTGVFWRICGLGGLASCTPQAAGRGARSRWCSELTQ